MESAQRGTLMRKVGFLTIGQSPRPDILSTMEKYLPENVEILERGALDGLDLNGVKALEPENGEPVLVTTMNDGTSVLVTHQKIVPLMKIGANAMIDQGAEIIVILCTGGFKEIQSDKALIVDAGSLLQGVVRSLADGIKLGIVYPSPQQVVDGGAEEGEPWKECDVVLTSAFPYASPDVRIQEWEQSAKTLKDQHVDLTFLNCMGMDLEMKNVFQSVTGKPVVLASSVVARIVDEMVSGSDIPAVRPKETSVAI